MATAVPQPPPPHQPPALRPGDRVRLVAASSALADLERLQAGLAVLAGWGLALADDPARLAARRWGYLAGRDAERAGDLQPEAAPGQAAALLACVRGGWGSARLLERPLEAAGGWLLGFSDVTSLLWHRLATGQGGAIHGPLLTTLAAEPAWSRERLRALLFGEPLADLAGEVWVGGQAEGPLLAANLTVATHLLGTPYLPPLDGAILILEDVGEAPYRIERMLTHWRLCGALQRLGGLGFGSFEGCGDPTGPEDDGARFSLEQVLRERTAELGIPVLAGLPVGHGEVNAALPLGVRARLDGDRGRLSLLETAPGPVSRP
ncbi:MccF-like protein (microcin C7 resistance) [Cyanobium sp. Copco_Reservoir_LC18]|uniref:S66 peptidase family protein n=1 Tax=Cyanobium sp. Copco_Reservoir_LC18 TaxID=1328305 RepID=UPI00135C92D1|nr:LD-carboxypeptidase [Cyanobium sp. Copco_Reservoir_LC18]KAF0653203.1 MccF-like protein (microcin C7 resistance) [Cyanobium sp. Copco_Reservoir_LC18]